jgi:thiol-disulfide isomerase/thioredoxin
MIDRMLAAAVCLVGGAVCAQDTAPAGPIPVPPAEVGKPAQPAPLPAAETLAVGAKAPALSIEKWVKGDPVKKLETGKGYIVEFWATWCTPCRASIPHLSELQAQLKDKGLTVIGVASGSLNDQLAEVEAFVGKMGEKMSYTVAWDLEGGTCKAWYEASRQEGIPAAFIVNTDGRIAWIGNPLYPEGELDAVATEVVEGTFDMNAAVAKAKHDAEIQQKAGKILEEVGSLWQADKKKEAMAKLEEAIALDAVRFGDLAIQRFGVLLVELKDPDSAYSYAAKLADGVFKDQAVLLSALASVILSEEVEKKNLPMARKLAERANDVSKGKNPAILDTLARAHFVSGDLAKAVDFQTKAVAAAKDEDMKADLEATLEKYKKPADGPDKR